jgi:hypothetical protein
MASAEQQVISNLKLFSRSIGFSVTREAIDGLPLENPPVLPIDHNRPNNNSLLTANSRGSTGVMGFWFWGSMASFVPKAIELQSCQGRSRPVLDGGGVDRQNSARST